MRRATLLARLLVTPPRLQPAAPPFTRAGGRKRLRVRTPREIKRFVAVEIVSARCLVSIKTAG